MISWIRLPFLQLPAKHTMSGPQSSHDYESELSKRESELSKRFGPLQAPQRSNEENMNHLRHPNAPSNLTRKLKVRRFKPQTWSIYSWEGYLASCSKWKDSSTTKEEENAEFVRLVKDITRSMQHLHLEDEPWLADYFVCEDELSSPPDDEPSRQPSDNIWQQSNPSNRPSTCWRLRGPDFPNRGDHR